MMKKITISSLLIACLLIATSSFAAWTKVGVEAGSVGSGGSPTTQITYEFTATVENTISTLNLPTFGGCITWIYLDLLTPTPDSITTAVRNSFFVDTTSILDIPVTGPVTTALTADGILYQPDTGSPLCIAKGLSYAFTGTIAVGDKFRIITEVMVDK